MEEEEGRAGAAKLEILARGTSLGPMESRRATRVRRATSALALACLAALSAAAAPREARGEPPPGVQEGAQDNARARARASFDRAERAAAELRFAEALAAYQETLTIDPSSPLTSAARARAHDLTAHAEGGFAPLKRLEEVRRDPKKASDEAAIDALLVDARGFPQGRVRTEALLFVAEALRSRLSEPRRAAAIYEELLADPASDDLLRSLALSSLVAVYRELGDLEAARLAVDRSPGLAPALRSEVHRLVRRGHVKIASLALVSALAVVGAASFARAARSMPVHEATREIVRPLAVAFALYLGAAGAVLVRLYGAGDVRPFLWLGLGVLGIDVIARAWRIGSSDTRAAARAARALACAAGVLAVAFLALERADAGYLESFGL